MKQGWLVIMICWLVNSRLAAQNNQITPDSIEKKNTLPTIRIQEKKNWNEIITVPDIFNQSILCRKKSIADIGRKNQWQYYQQCNASSIG